MCFAHACAASSTRRRCRSPTHPIWRARSTRSPPKTPTSMCTTTRGSPWASASGWASCSACWPHARRGPSAMSSLVQSVKEVAIGLIDQASDRLSLLGLEIAEERERVMAMVLSALAAAFFVALTVVFGAFWIVAAYWDTPYRLRAVRGLTLAPAV